MGSAVAPQEPLEQQAQTHLEHRLDSALLTREVYALVFGADHLQQLLQRQMEVGRRIAEPAQPLMTIRNERASQLL
jgi:hypothetical protein